MKKYFEILKKVKLFENINENDMESMLICLGASVAKFKKDEFILLAGDKPIHIGIVLSGNLHIIKEDINGQRVLIAGLTMGGFFAEALCCAGVSESPVSVVCDTNAVVMLLEFQRILHTCPNSCLFHTRLIENMLIILAEKNLSLQNRMDFMSKKTVRMKVISYLEALAKKQGRNIIVPFNREELADFLCVDRSALSHELSRMKQDGVLDYHKNSFRLL